MNKVLKRILVTVLVCGLIAGGAYGALFTYRKTNAVPVNVYSVGEIASNTYYYAEEEQSYGSVSADRVQSCFLSNTQNVKTVLVTSGQDVKKGDPLYTFDTTLTDIQLARAENDFAQQELALQHAKEDLEKISRLRPSAEPTDDRVDDYPDDTESLPEDVEEPPVVLDEEETFRLLSGDGSYYNPYVYLWSYNDVLDDEGLAFIYNGGQSKSSERTISWDGGDDSPGFFTFAMNSLIGTKVWADDAADFFDNAAADPADFFGGTYNPGDFFAGGTDNPAGFFDGTGNPADLFDGTFNPADFFGDGDAFETESMVEEIAEPVGNSNGEVGEGELKDEDYYFPSDDTYDGGEEEEAFFDEGEEDTQDADGFFQAESNVEDIMDLSGFFEDEGEGQGPDDEFMFDEDLFEDEEGALLPPDEDPAPEDEPSSESTSTQTSDSTPAEEPGEGDKEELIDDETIALSESESAPEGSTESGTSVVDYGPDGDAYAVLEVHKYNNSEGELLLRYGLHLFRINNEISVRLYNPDVSEEASHEETGNHHPELDDADLDGYGDYADGADYGEDAGSTDSIPTLGRSEIDMNASYTAKEISEMRTEKETEIRDQTIAVKKSEITLREMKAELSDGTVKSKLDGVVKTVRDPEEAQSSGQALIQVSGGGGYYINVAVGEFDLMNIETGSEASVTSFDGAGDTMIGTIDRVSEFPSSNDFWSTGNPNTSYYPCKIAMGDEVELREDDYVGVTFTESESSGPGGTFIDSMFVRSSSSGYYVFKKGEDGLLKKQPIQVGLITTDATEVKGGISKGDYIAFPYGADCVEGAKTEDSTYEQLYGY